MAEDKKNNKNKAKENTNTATATKEKSKGKASGKKGVAYNKITATCACGAAFDTGSTKDKIRVDICANCHPFFTGEQRILDIEGRVDKFKKKYNLK